MLALVLSGGARSIFLGKIGSAVGTLLFCSISIIVAIVQATDIPWTFVGPLILIGIGVITLVRVVFLREQPVVEESWQ